MPRNCSDIPFWGPSLNPLFFDRDTDGATIGRGPPVSQQQSWECNPDFLTPLPVLWPSNHMLLTRMKQACLSQHLEGTEWNCNLFISLSNIHMPFISSANWEKGSRSFSTLKNLLLINFSKNTVFISENKQDGYFCPIVSYCVTLAVWPLGKPTEAASRALPMASSFASFSMWPSLYWGRASHGSWQRHVSWTSQPLTWLFLFLLFWMLLDHKRTQFSCQLHPTCHLKCSQWWQPNRASARVQGNFPREEGKAGQPDLQPMRTISYQRPQGRERFVALWAVGPAHG